MKKTVQTLIEENDIKRLEKIAELKGHTLSSIIRYIIKLFLTKSNKEGV